MNYKVNTPNHKSITFGLKYGSVTLNHGDIVPDSEMIRSFPDYFIPIKEQKIKKEELVSETVKIQTTETEPKKKAGRPKGSFNKKFPIHY